MTIEEVDQWCEDFQIRLEKAKVDFEKAYLELIDACEKAQKYFESVKQQKLL